MIYKVMLQQGSHLHDQDKDNIKEMSDWNKILQGQLGKHFGHLDGIPENLLPFLSVISETYDHHEEDRRMLERSIELSSSEMNELNELLRKKTEDNNKILFRKLNESLELLNEESRELPAVSGQVKLEHIADLLKKETLKRKIAEEQRNTKENELIYANRIFRVISQINQLIVRVRNEDDLYRDACRIVVEFGKFKTAWVALADGQNNSIAVKEYCGGVENLTVLTAATQILQAEVLHTGSHRVCNNWASLNPLHNQASQGTLQQGSCMILPIKRAGIVIGTFNLYAGETDFFNPTEIALLEEATGDMSFALDVLEKDRKRTIAEQKLRLSEWRLKQAQAIAHLGSWSLDFSTGVALWSKEALKIYGIDTKENQQSYESWLSHIHPDDLAYVIEVSQKSNESLSRSSFYHRIIRKDGEVRHLYSQADFEFDEQGKPIGLYGVAHDVTDIRETERALRESQADLRAIFDNTSEGFIMTGLDYKVKTFNSKAKEIMLANTGREILVGDNLNDFTHSTRKGTYEHVAEEVAAGKVFRYQIPFNRKNGEVKWFDFTVSPVYRSETVTGMVITTSDITERKLAELKLIESEKRYSELFHLSPLPMWVFDQKDLRFLDVNQAAVDHYGYTRKEFMAMTIKDIRPMEDIPLLHETVSKNKLRKSPVYHQSFRHQKKNGEIIQVEIQSNGIFYKNKKAKVIVARDVTERFRYVRAIEEQNAKLKEISWMQSHIIRAPLVRIMGLIPLICNDHSTPDDRSMSLTFLKQSADELDEVIKNITAATSVVDVKNCSLGEVFCQ